MYRCIPFPRMNVRGLHGLVLWNSPGPTGLDHRSILWYVSEHFNEECYERQHFLMKDFGIPTKKRLVPGSVPSIYPKRKRDSWMRRSLRVRVLPCLRQHRNAGLTQSAKNWGFCQNCCKKTTFHLDSMRYSKLVMTKKIQLWNLKKLLLPQLHARPQHQWKLEHEAWKFKSVQRWKKKVSCRNSQIWVCKHICVSLVSIMYCLVFLTKN